MRFHNAMREAEAKLIYQSNELLVGLKNPTLRALLSVWEAIKDEFGVDADSIVIEYHDEHITLTVPFGTEKEVMEEEKEEVVDSDVEAEESPKQKEDYVRLTDKVMYRVENGELIFVYDGNGTRHNLFRVDMQRIYDLYDELPEKADRKAVTDVLERLKVRVPASHVNYLMQFLASYPVFSAELVKEKGRNYLIKKDSRVTEMRDKLSVEREVIGTPWEVA